MQGLDWEKEEEEGKSRTVRLQDQQAGAAEWTGRVWGGQSVRPYGIFCQI